MKIVIFGGGGFLGTKLKKLFSEKGHVVLCVDNKENSKYKIDATNIGEVDNFLEKENPEIVIDVIGLTSSVECEKNPELAKKLNFLTAKNISLTTKKINSKFFFISSSYVFDGEKGNYIEKDFPSPKGVYAKTKFEAEKELLKENNNVIFRVDLLYGYNGKNNPNGIFEKILSNKEIFLGNPNQIRSPLFIYDLPSIVEQLYSINANGLFHLAGPDKISMLELIQKLEKLIRPDSKISILGEQELLVKPMNDSSLNIDKIHKLGIETTGLEEGLKRIKKQLE